jgi:hypothetical protein
MMHSPPAKGVVSVPRVKWQAELRRDSATARMLFGSGVEDIITVIA